MVKLDEKLVGACGLYCGWCPYYVAGTEEFRCGGCWTREECRIRNCASERGLRVCTFCPEFPCQKLYDMYARMSEFFDQIKKDFPNGVEG